MIFAVVLALAGITPASATAAARPHRPIPVVYDSDLDFDDAVTLAYLCREHKRQRIDLRAVTVTNNGIGVPGRALTHARSILRHCGLSQVPVADGSDTGVHPPPPEALELFERVLTGALGDGDRPDQPAPVPAARLIADTVRHSGRQVTVLATGPLSNVAAAVRDPRVAERIDRLYVMGGAFDVPGNLFGSTAGGFDNTQEVNIWLDPPSAGEVFERVPRARVRIVSLDATQYVPITLPYLARLGAEAETEEARLVHRIMSHPEIPPLVEDGGMFWWDPLAATSILDHRMVGYRVRKVDVVLPGVSSGRTVVTPDGTPQRVAHTADRARFERTFLTRLNGRE
ncbi:nucleoside hydrolase [Amycolatopsis nigrescens]|uniref:nucleoside hydrolase n=1 Tax=Amycolatopsis nigrescens TaxID=381445 RepID=UPI00037DBC7B|nr:nucleoside hydrolase [Amycolatopsis nigrescens]